MTITRNEKKILIDFLQHKLEVNKSYDSSIFVLKTTFSTFDTLYDVINIIRDKQPTQDDIEILHYNIEQLKSVIESYSNKKYNKQIKIALANLENLRM